MWVPGATPKRHQTSNKMKLPTKEKLGKIPVTAHIPTFGSHPGMTS